MRWIGSYRTPELSEWKLAGQPPSPQVVAALAETPHHVIAPVKVDLTTITITFTAACARGDPRHQGGPWPCCGHPTCCGCLCHRFDAKVLEHL